MKKVLLVVSFLAFYSIQSFGITYYAERYALWDSAKIKELDSLGFFDGNINQTNILEKNKDYIVIRNTSVNSTMEYRKQKVFPEIFLLEADSNCKKQKKLRKRNGNPKQKDKRCQKKHVFTFFLTFCFRFSADFRMMSRT